MDIFPEHRRFLAFTCEFGTSHTIIPLGFLWPLIFVLNC